MKQVTVLQMVNQYRIIKLLKQNYVAPLNV